jgi:hypothetical protein
MDILVRVEPFDGPDFEQLVTSVLWLGAVVHNVVADTGFPPDWPRTRTVDAAADRVRVALEPFREFYTDEDGDDIAIRRFWRMVAQAARCIEKVASS